MAVRLYETYIGDGAYVYMTAWGDVMIYTSNGIEETNSICLEPSVLSSFQEWLDWRHRSSEPIDEPTP